MASNNQFIRKIQMIRLLLKRNGWKRAEYIRKNNIFHSIGENCYYHPFKLPPEPFLISMGDNVFVGTNVHLITHNMVNCVFNNMQSYKYNNLVPIVGRINIGDNVFIGANSTILYNVDIGNRVIIAAGAVVTRSVPDGSVIAGVPARIIGKFEDQVDKCIEFNKLLNDSTSKDADLWEKYKELLL